MPASFVDEQVQFVATAAALEEDLAGVGSTQKDLESYYQRTRLGLRLGLSTAAVFSSESAAQDCSRPGRLRNPVRHGGVEHLFQRWRGAGL